MATYNVMTSKGQLPFDVHTLGASSYAEVGAIYIFVKSDGTPLYIGRTNNLKARHASHPQEAPAKRMGGTHLLARAYYSEDERVREEAWMINYYKPPLNDQLK